MPTPKWEKSEDEADKAFSALDAKADAGLDKVKQSRFTWAIVGAIGLAILLLIALILI